MIASRSLPPTAQATLLLTSFFPNAPVDETARPLTNAEWSRFALWLKEKNATPADLLTADPKTLLSGLQDPCISMERILKLLNRGHSLALAMEKWQRAGLWVITRSDPEYPKRLKQRLKMDSPPVLFGCGNKSLLNMGGLAVIGSHNASDDDLAFTDQVGTKAAFEGVTIVSGGARGVDEAAMLGAMKHEGTVIGVLADSLLKAATSIKWRKGLMAGYVVLVSPVYPEAGFNAGNAMARNKYIYCLADSSLVIHSGKKGGTLNGAEENLKKTWIPLWVKPTTDKGAANADLVSKGGHWLEADAQTLTVANLIKTEGSSADQGGHEQVDLFPKAAQNELFVGAEIALKTDAPDAKQNGTHSDQQVHKVETYLAQMAENPTEPSIDFYHLFTISLQRLAKEPISMDELIKSTQLHKSQLNEWLRRAVEEGVVTRLSRPVRYQAENKK